MTVATYAFEVMWDGVNWSDITSDVIRVTTHCGREQASQFTSLAGAGGADIEVYNRDGSYAPLHNVFYGASYPVTGQRVRVRSTAPTAATLWQGYLDDIAPLAELHGIPTSTLRCTGILAEIGARTATCDVSLFGEQTDVHVASVLTAIGFSASDYTISPGNVHTGYWLCDRENALDALRKLESTELGFLGESADGKVFFNHRYYREETDRCNSSQATFTDSGAGPLKYQQISLGSLASLRRDIFDHVSITVKPVALLTSEVIVWQTARPGLGLVPSIPAGQTITITAFYGGGTFTNIGDVTRGQPFIGHWGSINTIPDTLVSTVISTTSNTMTFTLTNPTDQDLDSFVGWIFGNPAVTGDDINVAYGTGTRDFPFPPNWLPDTQAASDAGAWLLRQFSDPHGQLSITFLANKDSTHFAQAAGRAISDRITITASGTQTKLSNTSFAVYIEAIHHQIDREGVHWTTFDCSTVNALTPSTNVPVLRWGIGKWGINTWG